MFNINICEQNYGIGCTKIIMSIEVDGRKYNKYIIVADEMIRNEIYNDMIINNMKQDIVESSAKLKAIWSFESQQDFVNSQNSEDVPTLAEIMSRDFLGTMYNSLDSEDNSRCNSRCNWKEEGF